MCSFPSHRERLLALWLLPLAQQPAKSLTFLHGPYSTCWAPVTSHMIATG